MKEKKATCNSKMAWFDHGVWYILTHLELFFDKEGIVAKLMAFIYFLSAKAKESMLDHITFTFIQSMMLEACFNLYEHPIAPIFNENLALHTRSMIEKLIKPTQFTEDLSKRSIDTPYKWR